MSHWVGRLSVFVVLVAMAVVTLSERTEIYYLFGAVNWGMRSGQVELLERVRLYTLPPAAIPMVMATVGSLIAYLGSSKGDLVGTMRFLLVWCAITAGTGFLLIAIIGAVWVYPAWVSEISGSLLLEGWALFLMLCYTVGASTIVGLVCLILTGMVLSKRSTKTQVRVRGPLPQE